MTLTLTWTCDTCGLKFDKDAGERHALVTPEGWTALGVTATAPAPMAWTHACPDCARRLDEQDEGA